MGNVDVNGDGLIDMRIEDTSRGMGELRAHATGLAGLVTAALAEIDTLTGLLGKGGKMSDQFMSDYRKWREGTGGPVCLVDPGPGDPTTSVRDSPGLDQSLKDVSVNYGKIADAGDGAIAQYREAEQNSVGEFRR